MFYFGCHGDNTLVCFAGLPMSMVLPKVVGYKLVGSVSPVVTSTDIVLTITKVTGSHLITHTE